MSQHSQEAGRSSSIPDPQSHNSASRAARFFRRKPVEVAAGFVLIAGVMTVIQFSGPAILDNDGYYHIRWSRTLWESAPRLPEFTWLPLTTLNEKDYADHHFLFHVFLIPFTFGDLRIGAKLAAVTYSSIALASLFALMVSERVRHRWLWLAPLVASSWPFLYRMSMTRAPSISIALLALSMYLIFRRKLVALGIVSFLFVWFYSLFPLVFVLTLGHAAAVYVTSRRIDLRPFLATLIGVVAGMIVNPYFPRNVILAAKHFGMKVTATYAVDVGVEWYPYDSWFLLRSSFVAFVVYFVGVLFVEVKSRRAEQKPLLLLVLSTVLLLMTFWSRRFVEYWPPIATVFTAFVISGRSVNKAWFLRTRDQLVLAASGAIATMLLIGLLALSVAEAARDVHDEDSPYRFEGACQWLQSNTPAGSIVFNTDWDDFPILFYYNTHNRYIVGLDPTYLYDRNPELWKLYVKVTLGEERDAAPIIRDRFGSEFAVTDNDHGEFLEAAAESGRFETVYSDQYSTVLRVRGPGEPDPDVQSDERR